MGNDALDAETDMGTGARQLLDHHGFMGEGSAASAVVVRDVRQQQSGLAGFSPDVGGPGTLVRTSLTGRFGELRCQQSLYKAVDGALKNARVLGLPR